MIQKTLLLNLFFFILISNTFSQEIPDYVSQDQLIGYWPLDGNANDFSENQNHGSIVGAEACNDRFGNVNHAYSFDGVSQHISCEYTGPSGAAERTVSFWLRIDSIKTSLETQVLEYIFSYGSDFEGAGGTEFSIFIDQIQCTSLTFNSGADYIMYPFSEDDFENWVHFAFVLNGNSIGDVSFYRNGVLVNQSCFATPSVSNIGTNASRPIHIGTNHKTAQVANSNYHLAGYLDEVAFWSRALSDQEIADFYAGSTITNVDVVQSNIDFDIYPNPTSGKLLLDSPNMLINVPIAIYNLTGQLVKQTLSSGEKTIIDISDLPAGIYFLKVEGQTKRLVVI
ncbi:MAG: LamG-like jellyroll fold domain-containing protein [Flavobacteriales bacterium]